MTARGPQRTFPWLRLAAAAPARLDRMAAVPSDQFAGEVGERFPDGLPPGWQRAIERPTLFVHGYVNALAGAWSAYAPVWRQSRRLLELEAERIGIATVTGTLDSALALLDPRVRRTRQGLPQAPTSG